MSGQRLTRAGMLAGGLALAVASSAFAGDIAAGSAGSFMKAPAPSGAETGPLISIPGVKSMKPTIIAPAPAPSDAPEVSTGGEPVFKPGDVLPNRYMMLFDAHKYGLPRPKDGWVYFTVGSDIYRANLNSRIVLERMDRKIE